MYLISILRRRIKMLQRTLLHDIREFTDLFSAANTSDEVDLEVWHDIRLVG